LQPLAPLLPFDRPVNVRRSFFKSPHRPTPAFASPSRGQACPADGRPEDKLRPVPMAGLDPGLRSRNPIGCLPKRSLSRRSRASGNPGISVTCSGPPLSRGRRVGLVADLITASRAGVMENNGFMPAKVRLRRARIGGRGQRGRILIAGEPGNGSPSATRRAGRQQIRQRRLLRHRSRGALAPRAQSSAGRRQ
jgi:hypothetical protein